MQFRTAWFGEDVARRRANTGEREVYAVGDVHGCADLLEGMITRLENIERPPGGPRPMLVFLGDYIDRGPSARKVIELLISGRPKAFDIIYLKGNHEEAMLAFLEGRERTSWWLAHGGLDTLVSYDVDPPIIGSSPADIDLARERLRAAVPEAHVAFLKSLRLYYVVSDYMFVHGGIDTRRPFDQQVETDLLWIRGGVAGPLSKLKHRIVCGHTPVDAPVLEAHRIVIDTGAYATGVLSAVRLLGDTQETLSVSSRELLDSKR